MAHSLWLQREFFPRPIESLRSIHKGAMDLPKCACMALPATLSFVSAQQLINPLWGDSWVPLRAYSISKRSQASSSVSNDTSLPLACSAPHDSRTARARSSFQVTTTAV